VWLRRFCGCAVSRFAFQWLRVSMASPFQWLRRLNGFGVSVATPFLATLFEWLRRFWISMPAAFEWLRCFTFLWLRRFLLRCF